MARTTFEQLLDAGSHFGHLKRKWNPHMAPYIFTEKKGIHIIDLHKSIVKIDESAAAMKQIAKSGKKILFVSTKKQGKDIVAAHAKAVGMPYVTERWSGGMLTNFGTIRKAIRKMTQIDKMGADGTLAILSKRERLQVSRQREKLDKVLGSIVDMTRLPAAIFIVDVRKEHIALAEAKKLKIPVFAIVDTNSDPRGVDFIIPANDDATKSIDLITRTLAEAVAEGLNERKADKAESDAKAQLREDAKVAAKAEAEAKAKEEAAAATTADDAATPAKEGEEKPKRARKKVTKVEAKADAKAEEKKD
ncbi:MAG: 30S ribosomal protein S2 [Bacteroidetes bacterium]|nr:MAG: 30S ribosomal protein S2 [Bacteroidota bacterium]PCJ81875.1 MAG: 30S ribosomal protein S2 [Bacteroidota bacterium]